MTVRQTLDLERQTHRNLIEPLSGCLHPKVMLASRLVSLYRALIKSPKFSVRFLARLAERDLRTVLGSTLEYLLKQCKFDSSQLDKISSTLVKKKMVYARQETEDEWMSNLDECQKEKS